MRSTRAYHKGWQDARPFNRRVRWFQGGGEGWVSIRLNFCDLDERRECNRFYSSVEEATADYKAFIEGATVKSLMQTASQT